MSKKKKMNPFINIHPNEIKKQMALMQEALISQGECFDVEIKNKRRLPECVVAELHKKYKCLTKMSSFKKMEEVPAVATEIFDEFQDLVAEIKEAAKKYDVPIKQAIEEVING